MTEKILQLNTEKTVFWTLMGILMFCACFYMYSINRTIHNVVMRQKLESDISRLTLSVGDQEFKYISMRNKVTLPLAYSLGFKDVSEKTFISKRSVSYVSYASPNEM